MIDLSCEELSSIGFYHVVQMLSPSSPYGREFARKPRFYTPAEREALETEWKNIEKGIAALRDQLDAVEKLRHYFSQLRDIRSTLHRIQTETLDEIELFEIKRYLLQLALIAPVYWQTGADFSGIQITEEAEALCILDPDGMRLPAYSVHAAPNSPLREARNQKAALEAALHESIGEEARRRLLEERRYWATREEEETRSERRRLTEALRPSAPALLRNAEAIGRIDFLLEKARIAAERGCAKPAIIKEGVRFLDMVNPKTDNLLRKAQDLKNEEAADGHFDDGRISNEQLIVERLADVNPKKSTRSKADSPSGNQIEKGLYDKGLFGGNRFDGGLAAGGSYGAGISGGGLPAGGLSADHPDAGGRNAGSQYTGGFTPLTIDAPEGVTVITGANMGGKSVAIRTLALNVLLCHAGFYAFSAFAELSLFDYIHLIIDDYMNEERGVSSFAAEMMKVSSLLTDIARGNHCFSIIDEPARGTNPEEGVALVKALVKRLSNQRSVCVVTTHFEGVSGVATACYRTAGFHNLPDSLPVGVGAQWFARHVRYGLNPDDGTPPPRHALTVCRLLGLDREVVEEMERTLFPAGRSEAICSEEE